jgi:hypothetical protein
MNYLYTNSKTDDKVVPITNKFFVIIHDKSLGSNNIVTIQLVLNSTDLKKALPMIEELSNRASVVEKNMMVRELCQQK